MLKFNQGHQSGCFSCFSERQTSERRNEKKKKRYFYFSHLPSRAAHTLLINWASNNRLVVRRTSSVKLIKSQSAIGTFVINHRQAWSVFRKDSFFFFNCFLTSIMSAGSLINGLHRSPFLASVQRSCAAFDEQEKSLIEKIEDEWKKKSCFSTN